MFRVTDPETGDQYDIDAPTAEQAVQTLKKLLGREDAGDSPQEDVGFGEGATRAGLQGLSFNLSDEAEAKIATAHPAVKHILATFAPIIGLIKSTDESEDEALERIRGRIENFREKNPGTAITAEIAGGLAGLLIPGGAVVGGAARGLQTGTIAAKAGSRALRATPRAAGIGAVSGGTAAFGASEGGFENRLGAVGPGAVIGGLTAGAIPAGLSGVAKLRGRTIGDLPSSRQRITDRLGRDQIRDVETGRAASAALRPNEAQANIASQELRREAQRLFGVAEVAHQGALRPEHIRTIMRPIRERLRRPLPNTIPTARATTNAIEARLSQGNPTFSDLMDIRAGAASAARAASKGEFDIDAKASAGIVDSIDNFIGTLNASHFQGRTTNAAAAKRALSDAQKMWTRVMKTEMIEGVIETAQLKASQNLSGMGKVLQDEFKKLAGNERKMRRFSAAEKRLIRQIVKGGFTLKLSRFMSKLAPTSPFRVLLGGGAGFLVGGPAGLVGTLAAGAAGRGAAGALARSKAGKLRSLTSTGRKRPVSPAQSFGGQLTGATIGLEGSRLLSERQAQR